MTTLIKHENWDGASPPALPSGWATNGGSIFTTAASATPISSPNMVELSTVSGGPATLVYNQTDNNGGDAQVQVSGLAFGSSGNPSNSSFSALIRGSASTLIYSSSNFYESKLSFGAMTGLGTLALIANVGGTPTTLGTTAGIPVAINVWYIIFIQVQGTLIQVTLSRTSDGFYWHGGAWAAGLWSLFNVNDASISGTGYGGWAATATNNNIFGDDWYLYSLNTVVPAYPAVSVIPRPVLRTPPRGTFARTALTAPPKPPRVQVPIVVYFPREYYPQYRE